MTSTDLRVPVTCPACRGTRLRRSHPSRRTGLEILGCRDCGLHFLDVGDRTDDTPIDYGEWDREAYAAYVAVMRHELLRRSHDDVLARLAALSGASADAPAALFDLGAGDGAFLARARDAGFRPFGNELAAGAVQLAHESYGITLELGDLGTLHDVGGMDAVTMWCVLAHVNDGNRLLRDVHRILRPGGVLFLQTPRWSVMDRLGLAAHEVSGGRLTRLTDRRVSTHHVALHTGRSLRAVLDRAGYDVVAAEPRVRYSLDTVTYLTSLGLSSERAARVARPIDVLLERDLFFRNVIDVYARKRA